MWRPAQFNVLGGARIAVAAWAFVALARLNGQASSSSESSAVALADSMAVDQRSPSNQAENALLREQLDDCRKSLTAWSDNAAEANAEAELFRRQYDSLKLRMEALGLATIGEQRDPLEQRLLKSVRDLNLARHQNQVLGEQLLALSEAVFRHLKMNGAEGAAQSRLDVEIELRAASEALGRPVKTILEADAVATNLRAGLVLGYKDELSLLVANFGSAQGVKVGMPLTVARGDTFIGRARVVQVRERISGAVVEKATLPGEQIRVGDQVRVNAF